MVFARKNPYISVLDSSIYLKDNQNMTIYPFTLLELLIVLVVLVILISLLLPIVTSTRSYARSIICMTRQSQLLTVTQVYAEDYRGEIFGDNPEGQGWSYFLWVHQYLGDREISICPLWDPYRWQTFWHTYGKLTNQIYEWPKQTINNVEVANSSSMSGSSYRIHLSRITQPEKVPFFMDTVQIHTKKQFYYCQPLQDWGVGILHLRHLGKANLVFLDGHTQSLGIHGLHESGIRCYTLEQAINAYYLW